MFKGFLGLFGNFSIFKNPVSCKKGGGAGQDWTSEMFTWCMQDMLDCYVFKVSVGSFNAFRIFDRIAS